jgi:uncharacterized protein YjbJ (UPF0337 family)
MNWDRVQGNWKQFKGRGRQKWAQLTGDRLSALDGYREVLAGRLQEAYGIGKEKAERRINVWHRSIQKVTDDREAVSR